MYDRIINIVLGLCLLCCMIALFDIGSLWFLPLPLFGLFLCLAAGQAFRPLWHKLKPLPPLKKYHPGDLAALRNWAAGEGRPEIVESWLRDHPGRWPGVYWAAESRREKLKRALGLHLNGAGLEGRLRCPLLPELQILSLAGNPDLTSLDELENLPLLSYLNISATAISSLDLRGNPELLSMSAANSRCRAVSGGEALEKMDLAGTGFERIDLEKFPVLKDLDLSGSGLKELDLRGGHTELRFLSFGGSDRPGLWAGDLPALERLTLKRAELKNFDFAKFPALRSLELEESGLQNLDFPPGSQLRALFLTSEKLAELVLPPRLETLELEKVALSGLDLKACPALSRLRLAEMPLTELDLSANRNLADLSLSRLPLRGLNLGQNLLLRELSLSCLPLKTLDVKDRPLLEPSRCGLDELDLSANKNLEDLSLEGLELACLKLAHKPAAFAIDRESPASFCPDFPGTESLCWLGGWPGLAQWLEGELPGRLAFNYKLKKGGSLSAEGEESLGDLGVSPLIVGRPYRLSELSPKLAAIIRDIRRSKGGALLHFSSSDGFYGPGRHFGRLHKNTPEDFTFKKEGVYNLSMHISRGELRAGLKYTDAFTVVR